MMEEVLKKKMEAIMRGMRDGAVDVEAGKNAIDRLQQQLMDRVPDHDMPLVAQPRPVVPTVNINMDSSNAYDIQKSLIAINQTLNPQYAPMPGHTAPSTDDFGTPADWMFMPPTHDKNTLNSEYRDRKMASPMSMIAMRMKWGVFHGEDANNSRGPFAPPCPFDHMTVHLAEEKAIVFVVNNGQPVVLEDEKILFPSDKLVGQLQVLEASANKNP